MLHPLVSAIRICAFLLLAAVVVHVPPELLWSWMRFVYPIAAASALCLAGIYFYRFRYVRGDDQWVLLAETVFYVGITFVLVFTRDYGAVIVAPYIAAIRVMLAGVLLHMFAYQVWRTFHERV